MICVKFTAFCDLRIRLARALEPFEHPENEKVDNTQEQWTLFQSNLVVSGYANERAPHYLDQ